MNRKIEAYKEICRLAKVPEVLINNPELILQKEPTSEDIKWAINSFKEYLKNLPQ